MSAHCLWMKSGASGRAVNLDHTPIDHHEDAYCEGAHGQSHEQALEPQPKQRPQFHCCKGGIQVPENSRYVDVCI